MVREGFRSCEMVWVTCRGSVSWTVVIWAKWCEWMFVWLGVKG